MCLYFVRSILYFGQTGYEAGSCVCILLGLYCSVNRQDMKLDCVCILLGLYSSVDRQDMKVDRVSVFC